MERYYTQEERIIAVLRPQLSDQKIADTLGLTRQGIWHTLRRLEKEGKIEKLRTHGSKGRKWRLKY